MWHFQDARFALFWSIKWTQTFSSCFISTAVKLLSSEVKTRNLISCPFAIAPFDVHIGQLLKVIFVNSLPISAPCVMLQEFHFCVDSLWFLGDLTDGQLLSGKNKLDEIGAIVKKYEEVHKKSAELYQELSVRPSFFCFELRSEFDLKLIVFPNNWVNCCNFCCRFSKEKLAKGTKHSMWLRVTFLTRNLRSRFHRRIGLGKFELTSSRRPFPFFHDFNALQSKDFSKLQNTHTGKILATVMSQSEKQITTAAESTDSFR